MSPAILPKGRATELAILPKYPPLLGITSSIDPKTLKIIKIDPQKIREFLTLLLPLLLSK